MQILSLVTLYTSFWPFKEVTFRAHVWLEQWHTAVIMSSDQEPCEFILFYWFYLQFVALIYAECVSVFTMNMYQRTAALGRDIYSHCWTAVGATGEAVWVSWSQTGKGKRRRRWGGEGEREVGDRGRTEQEVGEAERGHEEDITCWNISPCSAGSRAC